MLWGTLPFLRARWQLLKPDLVHVHWVDQRAYHCARAGLRPLVLSVWGCDVNTLFLPGAHPLVRRRTSEALAAADLVIADSPDMVDKCRALAGRDVRVELLPLGIPTATFRPVDPGRAAAWRRRLRVSEASTVLLSARAIQEVYGQHLILEAFARAVPRLRREAVLVFKRFNPRRGGALGPPYEDTLRRRTDELGIAHLVRWLPEVPYEQLPEVYAFSDAVLNFPSRDAFPVTFLEAAACERPVITSRLPSYLGTFAERYFPMVEPGDVGGLAGAIVEFVNAGGERWRHAAAARREVETRHGEAIAADRLIQLYREVVGGRAPAAAPWPAPRNGHP
jgi:glycosyltransferase involved in cell wall biosynthesis